MRPVLVLLNGIPGSGKSTLARSWCAQNADALPLALDIDVLRGMIGGWRGRRIEAGLAARGMAIAAVRSHLLAGHDVLVPQYVRRPEFIEELAATARPSSAAFLECALLTGHLDAAERAASRAATAAEHGRADVEGALEEPMKAIERAFSGFLAERPEAIALQAGRPDLLAQLDRAIAAARSH